MSFIRAYLATRALSLLTVFLSDSKIPCLKEEASEVIHELVVRTFVECIASREIEGSAMTFNSVWQGYGVMEVKLARASTLLFAHLGTLVTSNLENRGISAHIIVRY